MALIRLRQVPGDTLEADRSQNLKEYTYQYYGVSNDASDRPADIRADRLVPKIGQRDEFDRECFVTHVSCTRRQRTTKIWDIIVLTSNAPEDEQDVDDPLAAPAAIDWHSENVTGKTSRDVKGKPLLTSSGSLVYLEKRYSTWIISVEKNLAAPPRSLLELNDKINNGTVLVDGIPFPRGKLQVQGLRITRTQTATVGRRRVTYRPVAFQLHYKREGWKTKYPDVDYTELVEVDERDKNGNLTGKKVKIRARILMGEPLEPVSEPVPLKNGVAVRKKDGKYEQSDFTYLETDLDEEASFSRLPLR